MNCNNCFLYLADDDEDDRFLFNEALMEVNQTFSIEMFENGEDLLEGLAGTNKFPDIIFIDLNMPMMDGEELLTQIRQKSASKDIPVVIYSTSFNKAKAQKLKQLGANLFFQKPSTYSDLKSKLKICINSIMEGHQSLNEMDYYVI